MKEIKNINAPNVDQQTIDTLKDLLKSAEIGELRSIIFVDKYQNGEVGYGWSGTPDHHMIGKLESVKFKFLANVNGLAI